MSAGYGPAAAEQRRTGQHTETLDTPIVPRQAALEYAARAWPVLPLAPRSKAPAGSLVKRGVDDATTDPAVIDGWYRAVPEAGVGVALAPAGLLVIGPDSAVWLAEFERFGLSPTAVSESRPGHRHYLYRRPDGCPLYRLCKTGEYDILSNGYVVMPPSVHSDTGRPRTWLTSPTEAGLPPAPAWAVQWLEQAGARERTARRTVAGGGAEPPVRLIGDALARWRGERPAHKPGGEMDRSATLYAIACDLARGGASVRIIAEALAERDAALGYQKAADRRDQGERWYRQTAEAAADAVAREPRFTVTGARMRAGTDEPAVPSRAPGRRAVWPTLDAAALIGLAGRFVCALAPHTEADPAALLALFLVAFGNAAGRASAASVGSTRHGLNENALIVGPTAGGRKDTARDEVLGFFGRVDTEWAAERVLSGLSTGEGLIHAVRDALGGGEDGVADKRLLLMESEFTGVLKVARRDGNTLSEIARQAWDGRTLRILTRTNPLRASDPHISIAAGVTLDGLHRHLTEAEIANGFANRFLFVLARRARLLDQGGDPAAIAAAVSPLVKPVHDALQWARQPHAFRRDPGAAALWRLVYAFLAENEAGGLVGALTARAEAHLLRLSCLHAALDRSEAVTEAHLRAAVALWRYCERSVAYIFGKASGSTLADRILDALASADGLARRGLHRRLSNHATAEQLDAELENLSAAGRVATETVQTGGRPARRYRLAPAADGDDDPWAEVMGREQSERCELSAEVAEDSSHRSLCSHDDDRATGPAGDRVPS